MKRLFNILDGGHLDRALFSAHVCRVEDVLDGEDDTTVVSDRGRIGGRFTWVSGGFEKPARTAGSDAGL